VRKRSFFLIREKDRFVLVSSSPFPNILATPQKMDTMDEWDRMVQGFEDEV
jgi:hypothetical protein